MSDKETDYSKQRIEHVLSLIESVGALTRGEALQVAFAMILSLYSDAEYKVEFLEELHEAIDEICIDYDENMKKMSEELEK